MLIFSAFYLISWGQKLGKYDAIYSGMPWFEHQGKIVSAHGANIIKHKNKYFLFGEAHTDTSNAFAGFNCYSSKDLYNWKFESIALTLQPKGKLGANRVGERVKVLKCPKTGEFIMYMHVDTLGYKDQFIGYATSKKINGPFNFQGPIQFNNKPIKKWDMDVFQDTDGSGYILIHGGEIYKLSDDYKSITQQMSKAITTGFESPAMFKKANIYYFLGSNLTSWEKNDNYYYTSNSINGPWTYRGLIAPKGTLTWNSQTTYVLPVEGSKDTTFMFMGDRWSYPKQASAATYVWQPLIVSGLSIDIPNFQEAWKISSITGNASPMPTQKNGIENTNMQFKYIGEWEHLVKNDTLSLSKSTQKDASFSISFKGKQLILYSITQPENGYAKITLYNKKGRAILNSIIDMYSKETVYTSVFFTPILKKDEYTLNVSVVGEHSSWSDKKKSNYGSTGNSINFVKVVIKN